MTEATSTPAPTTTTAPAAAAPVVTPVPITPPVTPPAPVANAALDFIPEAFRNDPSFSKYKSQDEFFKGVQNLQKMVGQKEIIQVNGIQIPSETATPEEINEFQVKLGRPNTAAEYALPDDIALPEGFDIQADKATISSIAFEMGLSQKQAATLMKKYAEKTTETFKQSQENVTKDFYAAAEQAFGKDNRASIDLAKKGAKALGGADKLNLEDVSNPLLLKALAMLGKDAGEDSFELGSGPTTREAMLEEAKQLQLSQEYKSGDPQTIAKVQEIYKKAYPENK